MDSLKLFRHEAENQKSQFHDVQVWIEVLVRIGVRISCKIMVENADENQIVVLVKNESKTG